MADKRSSLWEWMMMLRWSWWRGRWREASQISRFSIEAKNPSIWFAWLSEFRWDCNLFMKLNFVWERLTCNNFMILLRYFVTWNRVDFKYQCRLFDAYMRLLLFWTSSQQSNPINCDFNYIIWYRLPPGLDKDPSVSLFWTHFLCIESIELQIDYIESISSNFDSPLCPANLPISNFFISIVWC